MRNKSNILDNGPVVVIIMSITSKYYITTIRKWNLLIFDSLKHKLQLLQYVEYSYILQT